jgi:hypothetical protein
MKSRKTWRIGLLAMCVASLLGVSGLKNAHRFSMQSPTSLYLLAEFKAALGDTNSGLELLDRALAPRQPVVPAPKSLSACNISVTAPNQ